jgi:hypothetical protein
MPFRIWHRHEWYEYWPPAAGPTMAPSPRNTFATFDEAAAIVRQEGLYGAEIYQLVGTQAVATISRI